MNSLPDSGAWSRGDLMNRFHDRPSPAPASQDFVFIPAIHIGQHLDLVRHRHLLFR